DLYGNAVPSYTANVNVTYSGPSVDPKNALVINEIMYHPAVSNASYVEIFNNSPTVSFDLSNWRLHGVDYNFPEGTIITKKQLVGRFRVALLFFDGGAGCRGDELYHHVGYRR